MQQFCTENVQCKQSTQYQSDQTKSLRTDFHIFFKLKEVEETFP